MMRNRCGMSGPMALARGFSLLEILLVAALIALASLLAVAVFAGGADGIKLRASAKEIAAQLRYTRTQAIATGQPQQFEIDPQAHRWQAPNGRTGRIPEALSIHFVGAREAQPDDRTGAVRFFEDGASTGGRVLLETRGAAWQVDIAWLTGEVRVMKADAGPKS